MMIETIQNCKQVELDLSNTSISIKFHSPIVSQNIVQRKSAWDSLACLLEGILQGHHPSTTDSKYLSVKPKNSHLKLSNSFNG